MKIAFFGTGIMGGPMARNLAAAGHDVTVWNRTREKAEATGATVADSPAEAVDGAEALVTMLIDGAACEATVPELDPQTLWIQMSTVGVDDTARFADRHQRFMDCPVLGSQPQAEAGELARPRLRRRPAREIFDPISSRVLWLSDQPGAGTPLS